MTEWIVSSEESGLKLQTFIKNKSPSEMTARQIKKAIEAGRCLCNGKIERFASRMVGRGDRISFDPLPEPIESMINLNDSSYFLYADEHIIAYNKPPKIASEDGGLLSAVEKRFGKSILLHRLDKDTTGILLFARDDVTAKFMLDLFKKRNIKKTYLAIVDGVLTVTSGCIDNYLGKLKTYQGQTLWGSVPKEKGSHARTQWNVQKASSAASLIICHPETGRTHQIRVHLSELGHPILGDYQYGRSFKSNYKPERMLLHASEVNFEHPISHQLLKIAAPLPADMKTAAHQLFGGI